MSESKSLFTYDDTVRVKLGAASHMRPGELASVVGVFLETDKAEKYWAQFPTGPVYTIEFEDGSAVEVPESLLEKGAFPSELA